jgi:hypothetical protein
MARTIDLTQDAPKTHQDRELKDRIERCRKRVKEARDVRGLQNAVLGLLDLLDDEL